MSTTSLPAVNATATQTVTDAVPHVSWLKKFGHAVGVALGVIAKDAEPVEKAAVQVAEFVAPQYTPLIQAADGIFEKGLNEVKLVEGTFTAVGQASNGPAKLQAVLSSLGPEIDAYTEANFPGSAQIIRGEAYIASKSTLINAFVAYLNSINANMAPAAATVQAIAAASAAQAAVAAAK